MGTPPLTTALGAWTRKKQPTSVVVTVTNASEGNTVWFYTRSMVPIGASTVDSSGEAHFYDLDDGSYTAYEVTTGNAWSIVVSGATATVTPIASTGIAGFAHFG
jgi:hypothetical protein